MRTSFASNLGNWKFISFGVVWVLWNVWVIFNIPHFAPEGTIDQWYKIFISYNLFTTAILANADMRNKLFNVPIIKFLPKMAMWTGIFFGIFWVILTNVDPFSNSIISAIQGIPIHLALAHAFTFAVSESIIWQGYLDEATNPYVSALIAGAFHMFVWSGAPLLVVFTAGALFLGFSAVHWYLGKKGTDFSAVIGAHAAYNGVKIILLLGLAGAA